jgi:hypothetical protein
MIITVQVYKTVIIYLSCFRASAHGRFFFAAAADYFLAVRTDGERNATFSHFPHDLVQSV